MKRTIIIVIILIAIFGGAILFAFTIKNNFKPSCYEKIDLDYNVFNAKFVESEYAEIKDLGKSFLTLLIAVFVASITFSEKIVNFSASTWWSKFLLIFCWILLLISIVLTGAGLVFNASCFNQALYVPCPDNLDLFELVFICFVLSGLCFGLGLSSMLAAGVISLVHKIEEVKRTQ